MGLLLLLGILASAALRVRGPALIGSIKCKRVSRKAKCLTWVDCILAILVCLVLVLLRVFTVSKVSAVKDKDRTDR